MGGSFLDIPRRFARDPVAHRFLKSENTSPVFELKSATTVAPVSPRSSRPAVRAGRNHGSSRTFATTRPVSKLRQYGFIAEIIV